jgi:hypothetical protein
MLMSAFFSGSFLHIIFNLCNEVSLYSLVCLTRKACLGVGEAGPIQEDWGGQSQCCFVDDVKHGMYERIQACVGPASLPFLCPSHGLMPPNFAFSGSDAIAFCLTQATSAAASSRIYTCVRRCLHVHTKQPASPLWIDCCYKKLDLHGSRSCEAKARYCQYKFVCFLCGCLLFVHQMVLVVVHSNMLPQLLVNVYTRSRDGNSSFLSGRNSTRHGNLL